MADRDILFRIGVGAHPETQKRLTELSDSVKRTMLQVEASIQSVARSGEESARRLAAAYAATPARQGTGGGVDLLDVPRSGSTGYQPASRTPDPRPSGGGVSGAGSGDRLGPLREDVAREAKTAGVEAAQQFRKGYTSQLAQLAGLSDADLKTLLGADDKELLALAQNQADKYSDGLRKGLKSQLGLSGGDASELFSAQGGAGLKEQQREYAEETDRITQKLTEQISTMDQLKSQGEATGRALSANFRTVAERGEQMASGLGQAASGLAYLFADSSNAKKLIETLLAIKGTSDIVLGGFKAFSGVAQFFSLLGDRSKLLADKQKIQAEQTKLAQQATANYVAWLDREGIELKEVTAGNQQHATMLREVANAANQAAAAEARLNAQQNNPRARAGAIGQTLLGAAGQGAPAARVSRFGGFGRGIASLVGGSAITSLTGGGLSGAIGGLGLDAVLAGGGAAGAGAAAGGIGASVAAIAVPAAAAGAALGSLALVGKEVQEIFSGTATNAGSLTDTIASWEVRLVDSIGDLTGAFDLVNTSGVEAAQKLKDLNVAKLIQESLTSQLNLIDRGSQQQLDDAQQSSVSRQRQRGVENRLISGVSAAGANEADAARALAKELEIISDYQQEKIKDEDLYVNALQRANELAKRQQDAQQAIIAAVRQETAERKALNDASISAAEQRISLIEKERGIFKSNQDKIEDAAVRFARLNQREQAETIKAKEIADQGDVLSKKQRERLEAVGLGAERNAVRQQDLGDARRSGFFERFGSFENQQIQGSQNRLGAIRGLQANAAVVDAAGLTKEQREERQRALTQRQENIGLAQSAASSATAGGPRPGEQQFTKATQQVRVEIADRKNFSIQLQANEQAIARAIAVEVAKSEKGLVARLEKILEIERRKEKTAKVAETNLQLQQQKNAKPT